jgi:signal transduction histidine kinase
MEQPVDDVWRLGPQVIFGMDAAGRCTLSVGRGLEAQGLKPGQLVGRDLFELYGHTPANADALRRALAGESFSTEAVVNGRLLWTYYHPIVSAAGAIEGVVGVSTDVTDQVRAQEDLIRFKALADESQDLIALADTRDVPTYANSRVAAAGIDIDPDDLWTTIAEHLDEETVVEIRNALEAGQHWSGDVRLPLLPRPLVLHAQAVPLHRSAGGPRLGSAWIAQDVTERVAAEERVRELAAQREGLLERLREAEEIERAQIAAGVHDDSIQALSAVDLRLGLLERRLVERAPELLTVLRPLQESVSEAIDRLRQLLFDLEPPDLHHGLVAALQRAAAQVFDDTDTGFRIVSEQEPEATVATRAVAYRVAREAMVNARKHARARMVVVNVAGRDSGLEVTVTDDGRGIAEDATSPPGHHGLSNMRDRTALAGGRFQVSSGPRGGTRVRVWLPV